MGYKTRDYRNLHPMHWCYWSIPTTRPTHIRPFWPHILHGSVDAIHVFSTYFLTLTTVRFDNCMKLVRVKTNRCNQSLAKLFFNIVTEIGGHSSKCLLQYWTQTSCQGSRAFLFYKGMNTVHAFVYNWEQSQLSISLEEIFDMHFQWCTRYFTAAVIY